MSAAVAVLPVPLFFLFLFFFYPATCFAVARDQLSNTQPCGETINSLTTKSGQIASPKYPQPYPYDVICNYRFIGNGKERVQIAFTKLDLDYPQGDPSNPTDCHEVDTVSVKVKTGEMERELGYYCGSKRPPILMSPSTQLDLKFTSRRPTHSAHRSQGFQANYRFVTDYGIKTGKQNETQDCIFTYDGSNGQSRGNFTSPNYPGLYPSNTTCHYLFFANMDERIVIRFLTFDVEGIAPGCTRETQSDYVEFSNFNINLVDRKMVHFCGKNLDGRHRTTVSDGNFFRVTFKSNEIYEDVGFKAHYEFVQFEDPMEVKKLARSSSAVSLMSASASVLCCLSAALALTISYASLSCFPSKPASA